MARNANSELKPRGGHVFRKDQYVKKPPGFEELLPDLVRYDEYKKVHVYASDAMRETWVRKGIKYFRFYLSCGYDKDSICQELGITNDMYDKIELDLVETDGVRMTGMGAAHLYYMYLLRQELSLRILDKFILTNMGDPKMIQAIKTKSVILRDIILTGQDLGIVERKAKDIRVLGELNLAVLPTDKLQQLYEERLRYFEEIIETSSVKQLTGPHAKIVDKHLNNLSTEDFKKEHGITDAEFDEVSS